tara:strand:- start:37 stop:261 length:225 start_codon:yes stop_codon:yes gene_type:complete
MKPSTTSISDKLWNLTGFNNRYKYTNGVTSLKMGFPVACELMRLGKDGFTDQEIEFINSFIDLCTEVGIYGPSN